MPKDPTQSSNPKDKPPTGKGRRHGRGGGVSKRPAKPQPDPDTGKVGKGRPPALTPEVHRLIIFNVADLCMSETRACQAEGFDPSLVSKWKTRGAESLAKWETLSPKERAKESRFVSFFKDLRDALPKYIKGNLAVIKGAADKGDWRAADRRLEIADRVTYGRKVMVGNDPKHPLPAAPTLGAILILPDNRRTHAAPAVTPSPAEKTDGSDSGPQGV